MKNALIIVLLIMATISQGQVAVNQDGSNADPSAMFDVKSANKGVLIPRLSSTQRDAISNPATGLLVFVTTDSTYYFYQGNSWQKVGIASSGWNLNNYKVYTDSLYSVAIGDTIGTFVFQVVTDKATGAYSSDRCSGGTASASESYAGKPAANAFDNSNSTYWSNDNNLPAWLQYDFGDGNGKVIVRYRIYFESANYDASPAAWTFQASNNASTWITLDTRSSQDWSGNEWKEYTFTNTGRYRYYRINISDNKGSTDNYVSINEMEMQELIYDKHPAIVVKENNVGIGTNAPETNLHIVGGARYVDGSQGAGKILVSDATGNATWADGSTVNGGGWTLNGHYVYNSSDSIAIGTATPNAILTVYGRISLSTLHSCVAIGQNAGLNLSTGGYNTFIGSVAGENTTSGAHNTAIGRASFNQNTTGKHNVSVGSWAMGYHTEGNYNVGIGSAALMNGKNASSNIAIGNHALYSNDSVCNLVAIGDSALYNNRSYGHPVDGVENTAIGAKAMFSNTEGSSNTATGYKALYSNSTGYHNTGFGDQVMFMNTSGADNTAIGFSALLANQTGFSNVAIGREALYGNKSHSNIGIGVFALYNNNTGHNNVAVGSESLHDNISGNENCALGDKALENTKGSYNVGVGSRSLNSNTTGEANTAIGPNALFHNATGSGNTAVGNWAGPASGADTLENTTAIGNYASVAADGQVRIGNSTVSSIGGYKAWTNLSDVRFKRNIRNDVPGLDFIMKLQPVTYQVNIRKLNDFLGFSQKQQQDLSEDLISQNERLRHTGFIAQDVEKAANELDYEFSGVDKAKNEQDHYGLRYAEFVVPLVKAVQELSDKIDRQQEQIDRLMLENERLKNSQ